MYWILSNELADEDRDADLRGTFTTDSGRDVSFDDGASVAGAVAHARYTLTAPPDGRLCDHLPVGEIPGLVLSERLCAVLDGLGISNVEYVPLSLVDPFSGQTHDRYRIANVIGVVDCVDRDASDLEFYPDGDIEFIDRLVLDEDRIPPGLDLFRLAGRTTLVIASQRLKDAITEAGITGCVFYRPQDYA